MLVRQHAPQRAPQFKPQCRQKSHPQSNTREPKQPQFRAQPKVPGKTKPVVDSDTDSSSGN